MAIISVKNILIGIFGLILWGFVANDTENGLVIVLIVITTFGLAWSINNTEKTGKIPSRNQAQPIDIENHETQIRQLREKIVRYRPGEWTLRDVSDEFKRPPKIRLGVFGVQSSGKSTLLNSLHFSLTGTWKQLYAESQNFGTGGETVFRGFMKLTDHVTTVDTRGIVDLSSRRVYGVMAEISGHRGINPHKQHRSEKIDCPIFVFKYSAAIGTVPCEEFLSTLIVETKKRFGAYPIMVLTFGDSVSNKDQIRDEIILTGIPKSSVFVIENYTKDNHEVIKERHVALLKILEACILRADDNIAFLWTKQKEMPWWENWRLANHN